MLVNTIILCLFYHKYNNNLDLKVFLSNKLAYASRHPVHLTRFHIDLGSSRSLGPRNRNTKSRSGLEAEQCNRWKFKMKPIYTRFCFVLL